MQQHIIHWNDWSNVVFKGDDENTPRIVAVVRLTTPVEALVDIEKYSIENGALCFELDRALTPLYEYAVYLVSKGSGGGKFIANQFNKAFTEDWTPPVTTPEIIPARK